MKAAGSPACRLCAALLVGVLMGCDGDDSDVGRSGSTATGGGAGSTAAGAGGAYGGESAGGFGGFGGAAGAAGGDVDSLVPSQGALLGAFVGSPGTVAGTEAMLGRDLALVHHFFAWTDDFVPTVAADDETGHRSLITWELWRDGVGIPLTEVTAGAHDELLRTRARDARDLGVRFLLRFGHEMNGNWYPWDGWHNGGAAGGPEAYVATYRHVHDLFVAEGATNIAWVFCPNVESVPDEPWNDWVSYYPGDPYVDWLGTDGYNVGTTQTWSSWRSFSDLMGQLVAELSGLGKPVIIAETASTEIGGDKAAWIDGILPALEDEMPSVKALVWFHVDKETDWRIDSSPASLAAFAAMALDSYFNP